jgi:hypothetical protein
LEYPVKRGGGLADAGSCIARHMVDGPGPDTQPVKRERVLGFVNLKRTILHLENGKYHKWIKFVKKKTNIMDINNQQKAMIIEGQDRRNNCDTIAFIYISKHPIDISSRIKSLRPSIAKQIEGENNPRIEKIMWFWAGMSYAIEQIMSGKMGLQEISIEAKEQSDE